MVKRILTAVVLIICMIGITGAALAAYQGGEDPTPLSLWRVFLPAIFKNSPLQNPGPTWSESLYVTLLEDLEPIAQGLGFTDYQTPGCQDRLIILDFGGQARDPSGNWGTYLIFVQNNFVTAGQIVSATVEFSHQYWLNTGSDTCSHLTLAVGTNNFLLSQSTERGKEWARMINEIVSKTALYAKQVTVVGGNDIEDWGPYDQTSAWVQAYMEESTCIPGGFEAKCLVHYGNAHCPDTVGSTDPNCWGDWSMDQTLSLAIAKRIGDVYRFVILIPEIYNTGAAQARQWTNLSLWATEQGLQRLFFAGVLTQWSRCQNPGVTCSGTDNRPDVAWCQLQAELVKDPRIEQLTFRWTTDINREDFYGDYTLEVKPCTR